MKLIRKNIFVLSVMILFSFAIYIYGFSGGITGQTKKNGNGCTCHGSFSSSVTVILNGPETMDVGTTADFSVMISGGPLVAGGTNISASAGTLTPGPGLQILAGELTHQQPKSPENGQVAFTFNYTAPASEGVVTLFANGNSVNLNGTNVGDLWNFAPNKVIQIQNPTIVENENIPQTFVLNQNYPNPFNPSTTISYALSEGTHVKLEIYDVLGNVVKSLADAYQASGNYDYQFSASGLNLSSGIYYYKIVAGNFSDIKKMILIK